MNQTISTGFQENQISSGPFEIHGHEGAQCKCLEWLDEYFEGKIIDHNRLIDFIDMGDLSEFSKTVLKTLLKKVSYGQVISYAMLSELSTGSTSSARAVGNALRHNPFPIFVPCHRVVKSSYFTRSNSIKGVGGYCGQKSSFVKEWLIMHESSNAADKKP